MAARPPASSALRGCIHACDRCERVLDAITPDLYSGALPGRYPVGAHLRHALEHFQCFLNGLAGGVVDYDARARDEILETDPDRFRLALTTVRSSLLAIDADTESGRIQVRQITAPDAAPVVVESTVARELAFLSSHTIHHLALIAQLCRENDLDLPEEISLAFSTAAHRQVAGS